MTYCVAILLERGMVFASDSRTNADLDNVLKFCKLTVFERKGDRVIVLLSSSNLARTQAVINMIRQRSEGDRSAGSWFARTMRRTTRPGSAAY